jgi:ArsR family transcriptional regulator, arsenate/arsenite/antimonite-responsive transcriptional repressor
LSDSSQTTLKPRGRKTSTNGRVMPRPKVKGTNGSTKSLPPVASLLKVPDSTLGGLTAVFKLLADKNRLRIVLVLAQEGRMHVSRLCELLEQTQPAVSHHLTLMRMVGLVDFDRIGKNNYYFLASGHIRDLLEQFFTSSDSTGQKSLEFDGFDLTFRPT